MTIQEKVEAYQKSLGTVGTVYELFKLEAEKGIVGIRGGLASAGRTRKLSMTLRKELQKLKALSTDMFKKEVE